MGQALIRKQKTATRRSANRNASSLSTGSSLGLSEERIQDLIRKVQEGFPFRALDGLSIRSGIPVAEIASLLYIPPRTLARRKASGRLSRDESERLLRVSRIFELAVELFDGDAPGAVKWLRTPRKALDYSSPLSYSVFDFGAQEVRNLVGQLAHGVFP
jgi:putative toxin-antitoxin system antitoxin component (TIGR02293 family)